MLNESEKKALIDNLPSDWRERATATFGKSVSYIEKVCYGSKKNIDVFEYLVTLAEDTKRDEDTKMAELKSRLQKLSTSQAV
jgi:hypothetical protein